MRERSKVINTNSIHRNHNLDKYTALQSEQGGNVNRIRQLRLMNDMPVKEFAYEMGVGETALYKWELGEMLPSANNLIKMADIFDVSIDYILGRDKSETDYETLLRAVEIMRKMREKK